MFEEWGQKLGDDEEAHFRVLPKVVLERIITEHGGYGMTPDDAERFLDQVGAPDAVFTLICLKIETFRLRMDKVLDALIRYAANPTDSDMLAMAENAQTIFHEFMELCEALGLVESYSVVVVSEEDA
jgi:hypothetical protein